MKLQNKLWSAMLLDSLIVFTSVYISTISLFPVSEVFTFPLLIISTTLIISYHFFAHFYKMYKRAWEYASIGELIIISKAVTFSILLAALSQFIFMQDIFFRVLASTWMIQLLLISGSRFSWRLFQEKNSFHSKQMKPTLIVGAGCAGTLVARQLKYNPDSGLQPVAFIDDDKRKQNLDIMCLPVVGGTDSLAENVKRLGIETIVIAIPSLNKRELNEIYQECIKTNATTQMIPMFEDLVTGKVSVSDIRNVEIGDLLGRPAIQLDTDSIENFVKGEVILVTGAGGSIGSEICRQIANYRPAQIILLGHGENSIYSIEMELKSSYGSEIEFTTEIADIKDRDKIFKLMAHHRPKAVFHAAAHKHVPLMERNPEEAITNNVYGTRNVAEAADAAGIETFVMISSDKAVNPTSVMGATKRIAEMIVQNLDKKSDTRFVAVRFGNVLGSRGSVIPLFKEQIRRGGPITITHPEMERYFMTIPEASKLVLQAGALADGGEVFVLDMGEPVKIVDLARNLIRLSGLSEDDIGIEFTGMRPGEKLYEELLNDYEVRDKQIYPKIYIGKSVEIDVDEVIEMVDECWSEDKAVVRKVLLSIANNSPVPLNGSTAVSI
ncbi:polysaccharide biosynthesis protein [Guptibacillus hwajinpoensis]|uniref:FlaA1/EpsC-like NDP-sugar epimerase n=1 Tax=Guptibacillus hwajinpoensis TaxID=208199 RepID=A0ABU0K1F9_9BACL|nr:nucleoside-diphosphate sugar epimerase/dehydratase [Alkalihalobacillus hemicentroti]MDQ0482530.1 FlaA1/EpsC-like NDP-sugar epimerase [Alkalihalobacillus hemicentroti]